jgi:uncharacterized protein YwqG
MEVAMDRAAIEAAFVAAGLKRVVKDIDFLARASIRLCGTPVDESALASGTSRLGGAPDLAPGTKWPTWKGLPHSFIAQIRLSDVRASDVDGLLPAAGMLWFFYDARQDTYGDDPADRGGWRVIYAADEDPGTLQHAPAPPGLPLASRFHTASLDFESEMTFSLNPEVDIPNFDWTDAEQQAYETLLSTLSPPEDRASPHHHLLGNAASIQDDMRLQCQLIAHGITGMDDPRADELARGALDWLMLLQVDTDEQIGMRWASTGMLYYWIKRPDLQAQRFEDTWLVLQSE